MQAYAEMLNQIGLEAEVKLVDFSIWRQTIGNEETKAQTGSRACRRRSPIRWPTSRSSTATRSDPTNNKNTSNIDDPHINRDVDRLERELDIDAVADDWAGAQSLPGGARATSSPSAIGSAGRSSRTGSTSRTAPFFHPIYLEDFSRFCLKEGEG